MKSSSIPHGRCFLSGLVIILLSGFCFAGWDLITPSPTSENIYAIDFINPGIGWIVGYGDTEGGFIYHSKDSGLNWTNQLADSSYHTILIDVISKDRGWVYAKKNPNSGDHILSTTNGGQNWNVIFSDTFSLYGLQFLDEMNGWAVGINGRILNTKDGGHSWIINVPFPSYSYEHIFFLTKDKGWVAGHNIGDKGIVCHTDDGGISWNLQFECYYEIHGGGIRSVYFINPKTGWAVGDGGMIWHTSDGGFTWKEQIQGWTDFETLYNVHFTEPMTGWTVGNCIINNGTNIIRTSNGGEIWRYSDLNKERGFEEIHFVDCYHGWIVGEKGTIYRTTDGGGYPGDIKFNSIFSNHFISLQNYPNPFSKSTTITYTTKHQGIVTIAVYNLFGKKIKTLVNQYKNSGKHSIQWNGASDSNVPVSKGVYYCVVTVDTWDKIVRQRRKMVLD